MSAIAHSLAKPNTNDSEKIVLERLATARARSGGEYQSDYLGAGQNVGGQTFFAIQALATTVLLDVTGNITNLAGATIPAGLTVYGTFTFVEVDTGKVLCHRAV